MATTAEHQVPFQLQDPSLLKQHSISGGQWCESKSGRRFEIVDPGTGNIFASCPINDEEDVDGAVLSAHAAFKRFRQTTPRQRAQLLLKWHELILASKHDIARIVTYETGKPTAEALGELDYALGFPWRFAGEAERIHGTVSASATPNRRIITVKQPIGVTAALVPWNFPVAMILRKASAALATGCTMIIKPSPETPLSVLALVELAIRAGYDSSVLSVLTTDLEATPRLSEALCKYRLISKVTFTGSTRVGKLVARHCSEGLKKVTLELGGNCPLIIFDDADLSQALDAVMLLKWRHAGQACIAANRVFVQAGIYDDFLQLLVGATSKLQQGHGSEESTTIGPLTTLAGVDKVHEQVQDAVSNGSRLMLGGKRPAEAKGYFYPPTIIGNATADMLVAREETFGPLCAVFKFDDEEEVVKRANEVSVGLASYFFTKDINRAWRLLESLEAGMIGMNTGNHSAAEAPFGGIKESGYGKESGMDVAVNEYLIMKSCTLTVDGIPKL